MEFVTFQQKLENFHLKFEFKSNNLRMSMKFYEFRAIPIEIRKFSIVTCKFFDSNSKFAFGIRKLIIEIRKIQFEIKISYNFN